MVLLSLLPVGPDADVGERGARHCGTPASAEFLQTDRMQTLRWLRVVGDTIFAAGIVALGWFVLGLKTGWSLRREPEGGRDGQAHRSPQIDLAAPRRAGPDRGLIASSRPARAPAASAPAAPSPRSHPT